MRVSVGFEPLFTQEAKQDITELGLKADELELVLALVRGRDLRKLENRAVRTKFGSEVSTAQLQDPCRIFDWGQ